MAADGCIVAGSGAVEESSLTGEPLPIIKKPGDFIRSGARVQHGSFKIKAEKIGQDSTLGQMMQIIEKTLLTKMPIEGKTDVILQWFVPGILVLAAAAGLACRVTGLSSGRYIHCREKGHPGAQFCCIRNGPPDYRFCL